MKILKPDTTTVLTFIRSLRTEDWRGQASLYKAGNEHVVIVTGKGTQGMETCFFRNIDETGRAIDDKPQSGREVSGMSHLDCARVNGFTEII